MADFSVDESGPRARTRRVRVQPNPGRPRIVGPLECRGCRKELFEVHADSDGNEYLSLPGGIRVTKIDMTHQCGHRLSWLAKKVAALPPIGSTLTHVG